MPQAWSRPECVRTFRPPHRILEYWILSFEIGEYWILSFWSPRILNIEFLSPENIEYWVSELGECWILPLLTATEYWTLRIVGPEYWILSFWGEEYWILTQAWWSQYSVWWPQAACRCSEGKRMSGPISKKKRLEKSRCNSHDQFWKVFLSFTERPALTVKSRLLTPFVAKIFAVHICDNPSIEIGVMIHRFWLVKQLPAFRSTNPREMVATWCWATI